MATDVFTYLIGGKAGQGVKKAGEVAASLFSELRRYVFQMNDYQSLIRGGHNFSIVSTSTRPIYSHYGTADIIVNLDRRSLDIHRDDVKPGGLLVADDSFAGEGIGLPILSQAKRYKRPDLITGVSGVAVLAAVTGVPKDRLLEIV
jgi:2-oxoglutarate ferredoxin oxidoreductase subunit alpha